ncbi:MAG: ABC transporter substrate-binding protein [Planctomycetes bacterium]|nr:ABC transporter substrate-binding protein [Planctomycetota bacterium]
MPMATHGRKIKLVLVTVTLLLVIASGITFAVFSARGNNTILRTSDGKQAEGSGPYSVTMSPIGTVTFQHPPERVVTQDANYNDMLVAAGSDDKLIAAGYQNNFFDGFYKQLKGAKITIDPAKLTFLSGGNGNMFDKELLYKLDADIHHIDPLQLSRSRSWTQADIDEISKNVGPFFANRYSRENIYDGDEPYEFYDVWQLADKVAQVYRKSERIAALKKIGDKLVSDIQAKLPPESKRPKVALIYYGRGRITPYSLLHGGFGQAQYIAVGAQDAFEGKDISTYGDGGGRGASIDIEGLLAINPDVIIMPLAIYGAPGSGQGARAAYEELMKLKDDPLGKHLNAFKNNRVYPGGTPLQGPIFYIFQIEMAAKQIYPDIFGPYRDNQNYPPEECLFERAAITEILNGKSDGNVEE